jgi:hypothetical protein
MEAIITLSIEHGKEDAAIIWAFASSEFPKNNAPMLDLIAPMVIQKTSSFALNTRRIMESMPDTESISLDQHRWLWESISKKYHIVTDLWEALNYIIHAKKLYISFEDAPLNSSVIQSGGVIIPCLLAETDRKKMAYIDLFSLAWAFFYEVLPKTGEFRIE